MNNERFTQGEWCIVDNHHFCDIESPIGRIASMCASGFGATDKNHADAHLISAAPDMYRALREVAGWLEEICDCMEEAEMLERCKAALAKADGDKQQ